MFRSPSSYRPLPLSQPTRAEALEPRTLFATTNDTYAGLQYALTTAGASSAWDTTRGSAAVVVADIDSGADYTHRDLYANVWVNQAEVPSSVRPRLRDTDGDGRISFYDLNAAANRPLMTDVNRNGYIDAADLLSPTSAGGWEDRVNGRSNPNDHYTDDIIGWDFAENDNDPFDDGAVNGGHGTHTAGVIGAIGNNGTGVSGVAQKVSMMIVRIFTDSGWSAPDSRIAEAIRYTADGGARVANASWGGTLGFNGDALYAAISYAGARGQLFVAAAGNNARNLDSALYNNYPAEYALGNIVAVAASTSAGGLASFSNYGAATVDVAAPGHNVLSTVPGNRYAYMSGTSMAAPMVTGAAALMLAANPSLTASQLKQRLISGADESAALYNRSVSDGELNVGNAIRGMSGVNLTSLRLAAPAGAGASGNTFGGSGLLSGRPSAPSVSASGTAAWTPRLASDSSAERDERRWDI